MLFGLVHVGYLAGQNHVRFTLVQYVDYLC